MILVVVAIMKRNGEMKLMIKIPLYNGSDEILGTVSFEDNLTLSSMPSYVNEGGRVGIKRLSNSRLVWMYYDPVFPSASRAEYISEEDAYEECLNRGRLNVVELYNICPEYEGVV